MKYRESKIMKLFIEPNCNYPETCINEKEILLGIRPFVGQTEHWGLKIGNLWFEVAAKDVDSESTQVIRVHDDNTEYSSGIFETGGSTTASYEDLISWCISWTILHPNYELNGENCQKFCNDLSQHFCGLNLNTQNAVIGQRVIDVSLGAALAAGIGVIIGLIIKGFNCL